MLRAWEWRTPRKHVLPNTDAHMNSQRLKEHAWNLHKSKPDSPSAQRGRRHKSLSQPRSSLHLRVSHKEILFFSNGVSLGTQATFKAGLLLDYCLCSSPMANKMNSLAFLKIFHLMMYFLGFFFNLTDLFLICSFILFLWVFYICVNMYVSAFCVSCAFSLTFVSCFFVVLICLLSFYLIIVFQMPVCILIKERKKGQVGK